MPYRMPVSSGEPMSPPRSSPAADRRHRRRTAIGLVVAAGALLSFAISALTYVPRLAPDEDLPIERGELTPPRRFIITTMDPADFTPPSDVVIYGSVMLRSHKSPLERIARAGR